MGLDMYLYARKTHLKDYNNPENDIKQDGYFVNETRLEAGYWRKHPDLHGYIVRHFADGVDECQEIDLTEEKIVKIIKAVNEDQLIKTFGLSFGDSGKPGEERYDLHKANTIEIFTKALEWSKVVEKNCYRDIIYQASW